MLLVGRIPARRTVSEPAVESHEVYSLLDDEYARRILVETYEETRSVGALVDVCGASEATVYRRLERLQSQDLVESVQEVDPDEGPNRCMPPASIASRSISRRPVSRSRSNTSTKRLPID